MSYIKYDSDLSVNVKNDINDLKDKINSCFTSISTNADNSKIDLDDPRVVVIEDVIKDNTFFQKLIGNPITVVKEETKNYSANASLYNDAAVQLSTKASEFKEEICAEINKVVLALEGINNKITEYEVSPLLELESFNVDYNESAYSFLYGYASVGGAIPGDEDDNTIVPPEVPIDDGKAKNSEEEAPAKTGTHTGTDGSANNGKDGSTNTGGHNGSDGSANNGKDSSTNTGGHTGSDGSVNNGEDGSTNTGGHTGSDGSANNSEDGSINTGGHTGNNGSANNGEDGSTNTSGHNGNDGSANNGEDGSTNTGGHTGNNGSVNNGEDGSTNTGGHNGNDGSANNGEDDSTNTGGHNGNNGNNDADDDELIAALMAASGSSGNSNTDGNNNSDLSGSNGNNGNYSGTDDDGYNNGNSNGNGNYGSVPGTGLFSGSVFGSLVSSSYIDKKDDDGNDIGSVIKKKYSLIYKVINSLLPLFMILTILGGVAGVLSTTALGIIVSILSIFGYFYLEKLYDFWVNNGYFGSNGKFSGQDTDSKDKIDKRTIKIGIKETIGFVILAFVDFLLVLFKVLKSYWFLLLLILLLLIVWLIIIDEDKEEFYNNVWFVLISTMFCLVFSMILVILNIVSGYFIIFGVIVALLGIWYVIKLLTNDKNKKKEIS